ncbi:MAG: HEPN domain-containing protein [Candidatus Methanoperedens sp.]|nr:MAG: HEPN domain-containing protein [Candidatus Methanoperedens sp.]
MKEDILLRGIGKADNDLKAVKYLLAVEDAPLDVVSFHCQQAVEKYLKAYLTWVDVRVGKTHDLASILYLTGR